jgi:hypothetical protein
LVEISTHRRLHLARSFLRVLALGVMASAHATPMSAQTRHDARTRFTGQVRVYYVAADEVEWTYVPSRGDRALTGRKDDFSKHPAATGTLDPNATTYRKALYRDRVTIPNWSSVR